MPGVCAPTVRPFTTFPSVTHALAVLLQTLIASPMRKRCREPPELQPGAGAPVGDRVRPQAMLRQAIVPDAITYNALIGKGSPGPRPGARPTLWATPEMRMLVLAFDLPGDADVSCCVRELWGYVAADPQLFW